MGVVITASPGPIPRAARATCKAAVHEFSAKAAGAPNRSANACSKRLTFGPVVIQSERRVSTTSAISSSPRSGGENGKNLLRIQYPPEFFRKCSGPRGIKLPPQAVALSLSQSVLVVNRVLGFRLNGNLGEVQHARTR